MNNKSYRIQNIEYILKSDMYGENIKITKIKFVIYTIYYGINKIDNVLYIKYVICNIYA